MVRPILEYGNVIWSPHLKRQSEAIEKVQRRATKIVKGLGKCTYEERLRTLKLPTLKYRRFRGKMIQTFKILTNLDDLSVNDFYEFNTNNTRDNDVKLTIKFCHTNTKKFSFSCRTAKCWNLLTPETRRAKDLNQFKIFLDRDNKKQVDFYDFD